MVPNTTAYQMLDSSILSQELENEEERRSVAASIKIILIAVRISSELSLNPFLGLQIHQITKKTGETAVEARRLYKKCLKFLKDFAHQT